MHTVGSIHVAVLAAASALSPTIPLSLCCRESCKTPWEKEPDLPLLPPSLIPLSASHTVDSTNNHLLSKQRTDIKNAKQRRWTAQYVVCCVYQLRDKATLTWMECVSVLMSILPCSGLCIVTLTYRVLLWQNISVTLRLQGERVKLNTFITTTLTI